MKSVIIFAFSVFTTAFSASVRSEEKPMLCVTRAASLCIQKYTADFMVSFEYCSIIPDASKCLAEAAKECKVDLDKYKSLKDFIGNLGDVCKPGTELNEKRLKHQTCLIGTFYSAAMSDCIVDLTAEIAKIPLPDKDNIEELLEYDNKVMKIACKYGDKLTTCVYDAMESYCGSEAKEFVKSFYKPTTDIEKDFCRESGHIF